MQRIRYGLTGLAFVFLMVLLGTAVIRSGEGSHSNESRPAASGASQPSEPLAELGVAPGEGTANQSTNQVQPKAR
jgi:hypothetical protein